MDNSAENTAVSIEMSRFNSALRQIVQIPKSELNRLLEEDKASKVGTVRPGPKPKNLQNREIPARCPILELFFGSRVGIHDPRASEERALRLDGKSPQVVCR